MGYKITERYSFGWTDPRAMFGSRDDRRFRRIEVDYVVRTSLETVPTETLCNLWFVRWGQKAVNAEDVLEFDAGDSTVEVMQELANRGLVSLQTLQNFEALEEKHYYVLRNPHANC